MPANYVLLEKITVGSGGASSITFSGIPQTGYNDLVVKMSARAARTGNASDAVTITFNGVGGTSYSDQTFRGNGTSVTAFAGSSASNLSSGRIPAAGATSNTFGNNEYYIPNYTSANFKTMSGDSVTENNATEAYVELTAGLFSNTGAITSITIADGNSSTFVQHSTFYLYGISNS